jgi:hypothetical protein|tara:strand:+ start:402 stop:542 length:141 start_codon:yes stop_codon:yes gene_type:complete
MVYVKILVIHPFVLSGKIAVIVALVEHAVHKDISNLSQCAAKLKME